MNPLEILFEFPILMVDGTLEEKKNVLGLKDGSELDIVYGYAECPFHDFVSVSDRWIPTQESFEKAQDGRFDACFVIFSHSGSFVVPWTRQKFKKEYIKFVNSIVLEGIPDIKLLKLDNDQS